MCEVKIVTDRQPSIWGLYEIDDPSVQQINWKNCADNACKWFEDQKRISSSKEGSGI